MADQATYDSLVEYYVNLLIIQYSDKPKARATIDLYIRQLLAQGILLDIRDGFSIETAIGAQLDIIGKYVGIDRFYKDDTLEDFFAFTTYSENDPDLDPKWGFNTYADFDTLIENGTLNYNSVLVKDSSLDDEDYRLIIKLKIIQNNSDHSHGSIDDGIYKIFGDTVYAGSDGNMRMYYFTPNPISPVLRAAIFKKVLPRPIGVGVALIAKTNDFYGMATYSGYSTKITGFADYASYATKIGEQLTYEKISEGM